MALVSEAAGCRYVCRPLPTGEQMPGTRQADLNEVGVRRGSVGRTKGAGELETVRGADRPGQRVSAEVPGGVVVQPLARPASHPPVASCRDAVFRAAEMRAQQGEDVVQGRVALKAPCPANQGATGDADHAAERWIVEQIVSKTRLTAGRVSQPRPQPWARQVEHPVREAIWTARLPIMGLLGLDQDDPARRAASTLAAAEEVLHAVIGGADQPVVVTVQVVSVRGEAGANRFHPARRIVHETDAVRGKEADAYRPVSTRSTNSFTLGMNPFE